MAACIDPAKVPAALSRLIESSGSVCRQCGCSSVDRVSASEAEGRGFDPRQPRQIRPKVGTFCKVPFFFIPSKTVVAQSQPLQAAKARTVCSLASSTR